MTNLSGWKQPVLSLLLFAATAIVSPAQTFTTLVQFNYTDGAFPHAISLIQGTDGNLYGTTYVGGKYHGGTIFKVTTGGTLTTLRSFYGPNGVHPWAGVIQATDGSLYGTTEGMINGGPPVNWYGSIFNLNLAGDVLTTLYQFCAPSCVDGSEPHAGLVQASNGDFYGTTTWGGADGVGTVFEITAGGTLTTLHSFDGGDGANPYAGLVQGSDGNFYGTTYAGGTNSDGTIFEITPAGSLTTLYSFCSQAGCTDGAYPWGGLLQASDGNFYGTTVNGGIKVDCTLCGSNGEGTIFSLSVGLGPVAKKGAN